jgi:hypothetical protein
MSETMNDDRPHLTVPHLTVRMEDGTSYDVQADNRDLLRWDETATRKGWPDPAKGPFLWMTFLAWAALKRTKEYGGTWEEFRAVVIDVDTPDEGERLDPTQTEVTPG